MGYVNIPDEIKPGRNQVVMEFDHAELAHVISVLQTVLKELSVPNMKPQQQNLQIAASSSHSGDAWLASPSPRSRSQESIFGASPPSLGLDSSLFSGPFPTSGRPVRGGPSSALGMGSPLGAGLQQRLGMEVEMDLGLNGSGDRGGRSVVASTLPASIGSVSITPLAPPRPVEPRPVKPLPPIAPPAPGASVSYSGAQQPRPWSPTSSQAFSVIGPGQIQSLGASAGPSQAQVQAGGPPGLSQVKVPRIPMSAGQATAATVGRGKATSPGSSQVFPGTHGQSELHMRPPEAGQSRSYAGTQAGLLPVRQGPLQLPSGSSPGWPSTEAIGNGGVEQLRRGQWGNASDDANVLSSLAGSIDKMSIGQGGGSQFRPPVAVGPISANGNTVRGLSGPHTSMQSPNLQVPGSSGPSGTLNHVQSPGLGGPFSPVFAPPESKFSKGGLVRVPIESTLWKGRWTTAATEHNRDSVINLMYSAAFEGLLERDLHTGWLVSSSKNMINLWECIAQKKGTESPLQLSHSQATEFIMESMDIDRLSNVMISIGANPRETGFCIPIHSLRGETFFSYSGMIRVPDNAGISALRKQASNPGYLHAISLSSAGGPLRTSLAAAVGVDVLVYDLGAVTTSNSPLSPPPPPKAYWRAHDAPISAIHRSSFTCALVTGAADGSIRLWDMKAKPTAPARHFLQQKQITGLSVLDQVTLTSCSADGLVHLWDLRQTSGAFLTINPDGRPVVNMSANPVTETVALTTRKGLYCWELSKVPGGSSLLSPFTPLPPAGPCTAMKWNEDLMEVYVASVDGTISVFAKV